MSKNLLLSSLINSPWLIEEEAAQKYILLGLTLLNNPDNLKTLLDKEVKIDTSFYACSKGSELSAYSAYDQAPADSIAVHYIKGPLMKAGYWSMGMAEIGKMIQEADQHLNVSAHLAIIDSPGGTVDGTEALASVIKSTKKPFVSFVDGLCASAAYWLASSSNYIIAGGYTARIGSIGTMISLTDYSGLMAKYGIKEIVARADASYDKNESFYQLQKGNDKPIKAEMLNPINDIFHSTVKLNRSGSLELSKVEKGKTPEPLTGKVYLSEAALEYGLIDAIGTLSEAIEVAFQLTRKSK